MAFDADLGTRDTLVVNYSHDNEGGFMLFCGCGDDGLGHPAQASGTLVENNLSMNDGRRVIVFAGSQSALVRGNLVLNTQPGLLSPAAENTGMGSRNAGDISDNIFYHGTGAGTLFRALNPALRHEDIRWSGNRFYGYQLSGPFFEGDASTPASPLPASIPKPPPATGLHPLASGSGATGALRQNELLQSLLACSM
jgi:hypothetical protein